MSAAKETGEAIEFAPVAELLTAGGDARIRCDAVLGTNIYGCPPNPEPAVLAYGSSTASAISSRSYEAVQTLHRRLERAWRTGDARAVYAREMTRVRQELGKLCGLSDLADIDIVLAPSGTDLHHISTLLLDDDRRSTPLVITVEPAETGSGVFAIQGSRDREGRTPLNRAFIGPATFADGPSIEVVRVAARAADGTPCPTAVVDAEIEALVAGAVAADRKVLLNLVDVSKTGLIVPSPACALDLRRRHPGTVEVLVDACQFRLSLPTLRAYVENGFWVALTGSKFMAGPAFSGALLVPHSAARRLRSRVRPDALGLHSASTFWPSDGVSDPATNAAPNYGLLLRWEAAIQEMRAFLELPEAAVGAFFGEFASAVERHLASEPALEPLPVPKLDRRPLIVSESWDRIPTIFPFLLRSGCANDRAFLDRQETRAVWRMLGTNLVERFGFDRDDDARGLVMWPCRLGQPVACGTREGIPVSALRLCASARLAVDAVSPHGRGTAAVIADAMAALDKAIFLAAELHNDLPDRVHSPWLREDAARPDRGAVAGGAY